jgi:hypothetical protein
VESLDNKSVIQRNLAEDIHDSASGVPIAIGVDHASQPVAEFGGGASRMPVRIPSVSHSISITFLALMRPPLTITNVDDRQPK